MVQFGHHFVSSATLAVVTHLPALVRTELGAFVAGLASSALIEFVAGYNSTNAKEVLNVYDKKDLTVKFYLGPWLDSCCKFHQGFQCFLRTRKHRCDHRLKKYCKKFIKVNGLLMVRDFVFLRNTCIK